MAKIKICGLKSVEDIEIVNKYKPDFIGFIFANSKRRIGIPEATKLKAYLDENIQVVGVFVDEEIDTVAKIGNSSLIDIIQLHGDEDNEYIARLRKICKKKIIKAVTIDGKNTFVDYNSDYLLLDNGNGGTGRTFNWDNIPNLNKPFFLAGGLNANNVIKGIELFDPYSVDISSGVEKDGVKNKEKVRDFIGRIRNE